MNGVLMQPERPACHQLHDPAEHVAALLEQVETGLADRRHGVSVQPAPPASEAHAGAARLCSRRPGCQLRWTCSMASRRPPGTSTRRSSASAAAGSLTVQRQKVATAVSKLPSENGGPPPAPRRRAPRACARGARRRAPPSPVRPSATTSRPAPYQRSWLPVRRRSRARARGRAPRDGAARRHRGALERPHERVVGGGEAAALGCVRPRHRRDLVPSFRCPVHARACDATHTGHGAHGPASTSSSTTRTTPACSRPRNSPQSYAASPTSSSCPA